MSFEPFDIGKLEAAERQLTQAIDLFFEERDILAVHTLAAAAHGILDDICQRKGGATSHKRQVQEVLGDSEIGKDFHRFWTSPQNFLKHADRDPDEMIEIRPRNTLILVYDAIYLFLNLTSEHYGPGLVFTVWFIAEFKIATKIGNPVIASLANELYSNDPNNFALWREMLATFR